MAKIELKIQAETCESCPGKKNSIICVSVFQSSRVVVKTYGLFVWNRITVLVNFFKSDGLSGSMDRPVQLLQGRVETLRRSACIQVDPINVFINFTCKEAGCRIVGLSLLGEVGSSQSLSVLNRASVLLQCMTSTLSIYCVSSVATSIVNVMRLARFSHACMYRQGPDVTRVDAVSPLHRASARTTRFF